MIYRLAVWSCMSAARLVGEMVCDIGENGRARGAFRYSQEYLDSSDAFALDPVSLPLRPELHEVDHPGVFNVFEDSLPDDWGKKLLVRKYNISRQNQNIPSLLMAIGSSGLGALAYANHDVPKQPTVDTSILHLSTLLDEAEKFEHGETRDSEISLLLGAGSSPGGARPKALVFDEVTDTQYIAKLPSVKDLVDVVKVEAATMSLAEKSGIHVAPTRLEACGSRHVLLVERFDVVPSGRRHMISLQTLLKAHGYYTFRYIDVLNVIRKYSADPAVDSDCLFRQMVFNAVVTNTDDHLKNFWMVYGVGEGWRLSPAFDLVPDIGQKGEHVLFFDLNGYYPGRHKLEKLGISWGVSNAEKIVDQVFSATSNWKKEFAAFGVVESDILRFAEIDKNLHDNLCA